ncbi:MAG: amidohydrolase family protein [Novosphingobium sp.]|nr:amidohydrolase family protein [Novosphingobium sp.]
MTVEESPLDPEVPIIDPHLHLWEILAAPGSPQLPQRFLLPELLETVTSSGHNITHTVFVECHQMYRQGAPDGMAGVGETEFVNGIAAMSASGNYGSCLVAHRIVGSADLRLGEAVRPVLEAHAARAGERFRGIRMPLAYSEGGLFGLPNDPAGKSIMRDPAFIAGAKVLCDMGFSLDVWCLHTQLEELAAVADAVPDLTIVLNHVGTPETTGTWAQRKEEAFAQWSAAIAELARRPNVLVKLGGMGMDMSAAVGTGSRDASSEVLAGEWKPLVETCIEAFSPARAMFESNFPPDRAAGTYGAVWNAFKRIAASYSPSEKADLFRGTAARTYRIDLTE